MPETQLTEEQVRELNKIAPEVEEHIARRVREIVGGGDDDPMPFDVMVSVLGGCIAFTQVAWLEDASDEAKMASLSVAILRWASDNRRAMVAEINTQAEGL